LASRRSVVSNRLARESNTSLVRRLACIFVVSLAEPTTLELRGAFGADFADFFANFFVVATLVLLSLSSVR
jgi:hypothetical protein